MKKIILFIASVLFLSACGDKHEENENNTIDNEFSQEKEKQDVSVEVGSVKHYNWTDQSTDDDKVTVYAEIINNSDVTVVTDLVNVTYKDSEDGVLAVEGVSPSYDYLKPGDKTYIISENDEPEVLENFSDIEVNASFVDASDTDIVEFSISDEKMKVDIWGESNSKVGITGYIQNNSDTDFSDDEIYVSIGLYDKDSNLIGVENVYVGQDIKLDANEKRGFEFGGGSYLPDEIKDEIDHIEINSIGIKRD